MSSELISDRQISDKEGMQIISRAFPSFLFTAEEPVSALTLRLSTIMYGRDYADGREDRPEYCDFDRGAVRFYTDLPTSPLFAAGISAIPKPPPLPRRREWAA